MAAARFRMPTLAFTALSICLNLAIIGCAGRTINIFNVQHTTSVWLLPLWSNHFDTRELQALLGTSAAIVVLNAILLLPLFLQRLPANLIVLASSILSTACSLIAIIFPTLLNQHAPTKDTLQTWTCRWSNTSVEQGTGPPSQFGTMCHETRFAFYTTIPVFIIQLLLVGMGIYAFVSGSGRNHAARLMSDTEKSQSQHELKQVRARNSFETKSDGSPMSQQEAQMGGRKAVGFA